MSEKPILGGVLFAGAYCLVGVISGISKYLQAKWGFHPTELTFFNFSIMALCLFPWLKSQGGIKALKTDNYWLLIVRAVLGFGTFFMFFKASHMLPLVDAVTFLNTAPLWVPFLAMFIIREHFYNKFTFCILGGFIGMLLVMHPRIQGMNLTGDIIGLSSGIFLASTIVVRRKLKNEPWQRINIYYGVVAAVLSFILMIPSFKMPQGIQWLFFLALGVLMYFITWFGTLAMHYAKATVLGPLIYSSIIVSGLIGWLVWGDIPKPLTIAGMLAIIVSGILMVMFGIRANKKY